MLCCITDETSTCLRDFKMRSFRRKTGQQLGKVCPFFVTYVVHSSDNDTGSESKEEVKPKPLPKLVGFYNRKGQFIVSSKYMNEYLKLLDVTVRGKINKFILDHMNEKLQHSLGKDFSQHSDETETIGYESEHDALVESNLFPTGPDSNTSIHLSELPTAQENSEAKVESVTKKLEGVTHRTVPTKNVESVTFEDVTEGVESVTNENVTQQDFNHVMDKCSYDTSSEGASEDSMLLSDD